MDKAKITEWEQERIILQQQKTKLNDRMNALATLIAEETTGFNKGERVCWTQSRRKPNSLEEVKKTVEGIVEGFGSFYWIYVRPFKKDGTPSENTTTIYDFSNLQRVEEQ